MDFLHRTWAQIDLDNLKNNFDLVKETVADKCMVMSVIKADAYGHGVIEVARTLEQAGTDWFAVSNLEEGLQLRHAGIKKPILVLGTTPAEYASVLAVNGITQTVYSSEYAASLSDFALREGVTVRVHIKLDTGMRRIGFDASDAKQVEQAAKACHLGGFDVEGVFTHFASADRDGDGDGSFTVSRFKLFEDAVSAIEKTGTVFKIRHCSNSAAILTQSEMRLDMVRAGIILYGLMPSGEVKADRFKPVMSLHAAVSMVKTVHAGDDISYGRTFTAQKDMTVATVPIGYADGYLRAFSGGRVLINGQYARVIGRICMDQMMLDVSGIDVKAGDTVTLFGKSGDKEISVDELAKLANTINYEVVCLLSKRVTRVYIKDGRQVSMTNLLTSEEEKQ